MKTTYILHGGFNKDAGIQKDDLFFKEILNYAPKETKILLVYFAENAERVEKRKADDLEQFNNNKDDKTISFDTAKEETFLQQAQASDVIYLHGGHSAKLLEALKKFNNLKNIFAGKIVAGDSAGANVLTAVFYSNKIGISEGFGLIPIKIITHYLEENRNKLDQIKPELETLFLPEYETKVFVIES